MRPSCLAAVIFLLCYTGLAVSLFPYIIPPVDHAVAGGCRA